MKLVDFGLATILTEGTADSDVDADWDERSEAPSQAHMNGNMALPAKGVPPSPLRSQRRLALR